MSLLGFDAIGRLALGQLPQTQRQTLGFGGAWDGQVRKAGLAAAVIATTFVGFVAPPQAQASQPFTQFSQPLAIKTISASWSFVTAPAQAQTAIFTAFSQPFSPRVNLPDEQPSALFEVAPPPVISTAFSQFSQPQFNRAVISDEQPSTLFEILPPVAPPFTGFATFDGIIRGRLNIALTAWQWWQPIILPVDTHDGVWVKRKKRSGRDPIDLELEEKASRRAALELAVYGPAKQIIPPKPVKRPVINSPVDVADLAKIVLNARQAHGESIRAQALSDDEDDLESILKDIL